MGVGQAPAAMQQIVDRLDDESPPAGLRTGLVGVQERDAAPKETSKSSHHSTTEVHLLGSVPAGSG